MIDNPFREQLPRFVGPLLSLYRAVGLTPNGVTWVGFGLALVSVGCVLQDWRVAAIVVWWLSRLADGTDGIYARETGRASGFGAYLDIVLDMAAYGAIVLAFDAIHPELHGRWMAMLFLYILCITSALSLGIQEAENELPPRDDRGLRLGAGLAEGGETGIAYTLFLLFPSCLDALTAVWIAVLVVTLVARTVLARRELAR
jgi:phosphatidylglycerophosphate synthase